MQKETLTNQVERLRSYADAAAEQLLTQQPGEVGFFQPVDDIVVSEATMGSLGDALSRKNSDDEFIAAQQDTGVNSRLRLSALQLQASVLQQMERAYRHRHLSGIREAGHTAARLKALGGDSGLFQHLLTIVTNVEQQAGTAE